MTRRRIVVISDLHLGGAEGFQMMSRPAVLAAFIDRLSADLQATELVIAGDFVDFLAQGTAPQGERAERWDPLILDPVIAATTFRRIARESAFAQVFDALRRLVEKGHRLTVLLGNHDVELSYPEVRRELCRVVGADEGFGLRFVYDGEAYTVGELLIEHGNRYDRFNAVDHDRLRRARSLQSRGQDHLRQGVVEANAGSRLVAEVMNPIKAQYRFVDLLKPEDAAVLPLLLALEPGLRARMSAALKALAPGAAHGTAKDAIPLRLSDASGGGGGGAGGMSLELGAGPGAGWSPTSSASSLSSQPDLLAQELAGALGGAGAAQSFLRALDGESDPLVAHIEDASAASVKALAGSLVSLVTGRKAAAVEQRLPALLRALRTIAEDRSFELEHEPSKAYLDAAQALAREGEFRFVVFGHTHHAKDVSLEGGARYLNSGTWADLMRVPEEIIRGTDAEALPALRAFVEDVAANRLEAYLWFRPTYVELELGDDGRVGHAAVRTFDA